MRLGFLVGDPRRSGAVEAAVAAGFDVRLVLVPPGAPDRPEGATVLEAADDEAAARALTDAGVEVAVLLADGAPGPRSPLHHGRFTLLASHLSLLPRHRGAEPVWHALRAGDPRAGVTVLLVDPERPDAGPVVGQRGLPIDPFDTVSSLADRLRRLEPEAVVAALQRFVGGATFTDQEEALATAAWAPPTDAERELDPSRPLSELMDLIRACDERAPAWFLHHGQRVALRAWRPVRPITAHPGSL